MRHRKAFLVAAVAWCASTAPATASAQLPGLGLSAGIEYDSPGGDLGDALDPGYGGYLKAELSALVVGAAATARVIRFSGEPDGETVLGIQVGPRLGLGLLKAGLDIGRYTNIDRTGYTPNVSLSLGPLEAGVGLTFIDGGRWFTINGGLRF